MDLRCLKQSTHTKPRQQIEEAFTAGEHQQALSQLKAGKAASPNGITHDLIKHLSSKGSSFLLNVLNSSWLMSWCLQSWRSAYMIPFLKKGKDPADIGSYHPIALTMTIGKFWKDSLQTACHGGLRDIQLSVPGRQVSAMDIVPPTSACGSHNSSLMDFTQPSADAPLLLSSTVVWRTIVFGIQDF